MRDEGAIRDEGGAGDISLARRLAERGRPPAVAWSGQLLIAGCSCKEGRGRGWRHWAGKAVGGEGAPACCGVAALWLAVDRWLRLQSCAIGYGDGAGTGSACWLAHIL